MRFSDKPALPTRNFTYGAKAPTVGRDLVDAQLRAAHLYRNKLCELERSRREQVAAALGALEPRLGALDMQIAVAVAALDQTRAAIKALSQAARKKVRDKTLERQAQDNRAAIKPLREQQKALKLATYARLDVKAALATIDAAHNATIKEVRAASGLYWGNKAVVEQAAMSMRSGAPPEFARWEGNGTLAVQIQGGAKWIDIDGGTGTLAQISEPLEDRPRWHILHFRVGSDERGRPVWCVVPIKLHRAPPDASRIKWVYLDRKIVGQEILVGDGPDKTRHIHAGREEWTVRFAVENAAGFGREDDARDGMAAINLGFRRVPGGLRVLTIVDDSGHEEFVTLPDSIRETRDKARSIRGFRDVNFNTIRDVLLQFRQSQSPRPDWWQERTKHIPQWRSPAGLASLVIYWRDHRFAGDGDIFDAAEAWRKRDNQLGRYQRGLDDAALNRRKDQYRKVARDLARRYKTILIAELDLRDLAAKQPAEGEDEITTALRDQLRLANLSLLRRLIREACGEVVELPSQDMTRICHACGVKNKWNAATEVFHACDSCGATWDQDVNHCRNLLRERRGAEVVNA